MSFFIKGSRFKDSAICAENTILGESMTPKVQLLTKNKQFGMSENMDVCYFHGEKARAGVSQTANSLKVSFLKSGRFQISKC